MKITLGWRKGGIKRCRFCGNAKRKLHIHVKQHIKNGLTYFSCKPCSAERSRNYYLLNSSKQKEYNKKYNEKIHNKKS